MSSTFHPFQSEEDQQWYWRLVDDGNHKIIGIGGEGFTTEQHVNTSIDNVAEDFLHRATSSGMFLVLRKEHWEAIRQRALSAGEAELVRLIEEAAL